MADSSTPGQGGVAVAPPPTTAISQFALVVNANEMLIPVGHSRVVVTQQGNQIIPQQVVEWLTTLSVSPIVAKRLHDALGVAIENYERMFGAIPRDPAAELKVGNPNP